MHTRANGARLQRIAALIAVSTLREYPIKPLI
jgi:hypothetical protein